jgi:hypothetical protein
VTIIPQDHDVQNRISRIELKKYIWIPNRVEIEGKSDNLDIKVEYRFGEVKNSKRRLIIKQYQPGMQLVMPKKDSPSIAKRRFIGDKEFGEMALKKCDPDGLKARKENVAGFLLQPSPQFELKKLA